MLLASTGCVAYNDGYATGEPARYVTQEYKPRDLAHQPMDLYPRRPDVVYVQRPAYVPVPQYRVVETPQYVVPVQRDVYVPFQYNFSIQYRNR